MIDLHTHSTFSDGTATPEELIEEANRIGLTAIALTDHDIVDGLPFFQEAAKRYPDIKAINGCELAVDYPNADVEIIALNIQDLKPFQERQQKLENFRNEANFERIEMLQKLGISITWEDVSIDENGKERRLVGRPHFAHALMKKGYVSSNREAFDKYLGENGSAFLVRKNPSAKETIEFINSTGAVSILAHPVHTKLKGDDLVNLVKELKGYGLKGIECYHSDQSKELTAQYLKLAKDFDLIVSGGSDYHGLVHPDTSLGYGKGNLDIPDNLLDNILKSPNRVNVDFNNISRNKDRR